MEPLNYCRQMAKQYHDILSSHPSLDKQLRGRLEHCIAVASVSEKFLLPDGGYLIDDDNYRALDEKQPLCLPFHSIAIEFPFTAVPIGSAHRSSKRIILANDNAHDGHVFFRSVAFIDDIRMWVPGAVCSIPRRNYLARDQVIDGVPGLYLTLADSSKDPMREIEDSVYEARVLVGLVNALTCSNVHRERLAPTKDRKKLKSGALPFDSYHVLTINAPSRDGVKDAAGVGGHCSPREHLRRGHIRRLVDDRRIWVNATVVNPGVGGVVSKDYRLRGSTVLR